MNGPSSVAYSFCLKGSTEHCSGLFLGFESMLGHASGSMYQDVQDKGGHFCFPFVLGHFCFPFVLLQQSRIDHHGLLRWFDDSFKQTISTCSHQEIKDIWLILAPLPNIIRPIPPSVERRECTAHTTLKYSERRPPQPPWHPGLVRRSVPRMYLKLF